ncbi:MAG: SDR family NAD(P)-dependent oxidoreductase [Promethearchaeota archaeon]
MFKENNFMNWDNPGVALITGASSGIGAEFARQLASQGFDLILIARRKEKLKDISEKLTKTHSINAEFLITDLSKVPENQMVIKRIAELDNIDILINNAGFGVWNTFLQTDISHYVDMVNVHFTSTVMLCHAVIPSMIKQKRGVIINTSSMSAITRDPSLIMYTTTKSAISIFSELLNKQVKGKGIYIQSLHPGFTYSEFHDTSTMKGFQRNWFPEERWMSTEKVVSLSLGAVETNKVIFIPGELNQELAKQDRIKKEKKYLNCDIF